MLFLGLIIYLILFPLLHKFVFPAVPIVSDLPLFLQAVLTFFICAMLGLLLIYLVDVYSPSRKVWIADFLRPEGVGWLSVMTAIGVLSCYLLQVFYFGERPGFYYWTLLLPVGVVSVLNVLGIGWRTKRLAPSGKPGKVVLPPEPPPPEFKEEISKTFEWRFEDKDYRIGMVIRRSVYDSFKRRERELKHSKWAEEYASGGITGEIRELAHRLYGMVSSYGTYREVSFVLNFVQQAIIYAREKTEYPKYPVETLADGTGDCEDFSILGAALLKCMGYEVALMYVPGHAALGVAGAAGLEGRYVERGGLHYYYCEMSSEGWKLGEVPEKYRTETIAVSPVPGPPVKVELDGTTESG